MNPKTAKVFGDVGLVLGPASLVGIVAPLADIDAKSTALLTLCVAVACGLFHYRTFVDHLVPSSYALIALCVGITGYAFSYEAPLLKSTGLIGYYPQSNSFLPELKPRISSTTKELLLIGTHFYITAEECHDDLLDRLNHGVDIKVLILQPESPRLGLIAKDFGVESQNLLSECAAGIEDLNRLRKDWEKAQAESENPGTLEVRTFDLCPKMRMYAFDPGTAKGDAYVVPYGNMLNSPQTPGYLFRASKGSAAESYVAGFRKLWRESQPLASPAP